VKIAASAGHFDKAALKVEGRRLCISEGYILLWIHDCGDLCFSNGRFCRSVVVEGSAMVISLLKDEAETSITAALARGSKVYLVPEEVI